MEPCSLEVAADVRSLRRVSSPASASRSILTKSHNKEALPPIGVTEFDPARVLATLERAMYGLPVLLLRGEATRSLLPSMLARANALSFGDEPQGHVVEGEVVTADTSEEEHHEVEVGGIRLRAVALVRVRAFRVVAGKFGGLLGGHGVSQSQVSGSR
jgi:hypothetical protein